MRWLDGPEVDEPRGKWFYAKMEEVAKDAVWSLAKKNRKWLEIVEAICDGDLHEEELWDKFGGFTLSAEEYAAIREDADEWERCHDWDQYHEG